MVKKNGLPADDCGIAIITAAVLRRGRLLHHISLIFSALVLAQLSLQHLYKSVSIGTGLWMQALVLLLGLTELWFAARAALDADLFEAIADAKLDITELDKAMTRLGMTMEVKARRSMVGSPGTELEFAL